MNGKSKKSKKINRLLTFIVVLVLLAAVLCGAWLVFGDSVMKNFYPTDYSEYVKKYSSLYGLDDKLVYAFIKTESGFDEHSESRLGARGLMQIMPDTFEWIRYRLSEDDDPLMTYDRMFEAKENIRYGCYLLGFLSDEFDGGITETAAAYHAGYNAVLSWIEQSESGRLTKIPKSDTAHYVDKIKNAYDVYLRLYK